ncbi:MAG: IclR family transcriptional regulator [Gaiellales bacterium]
MQRAAAVLRVVAGAGRPLGTREISSLIGVNRSTTYHLVNTLVHERLLRRGVDGKCELGQAILDLYHAMPTVSTPDARMLRALEHLHERTGETCYLGIWDAGEVVSVALREGTGDLRVRTVPLGTRDHTHARALGRALLAHLDDDALDSYLADCALNPLTEMTKTDPDQLRRVLAQVRQTGVAIEREEFMIGVCCVAAPVFANGSAVAAISVSVPKARFDVAEDAIVTAVSEAAWLASGFAPDLTVHGEGA